MLYVYSAIFSLILTIIILAIQNHGNKLILVTKHVVYKNNGNSRITTLSFSNKLYNTPDKNLIDKDHFFVPLKGKSLFVSRKIIRKETYYGEKLKVTYSYNGYEELTVKELKQIFDTLQPYIEK